MQLDSVQIGATDVDAVAAAYTRLLGVEPAPGGVRRFQLGRGGVEIVPGNPGVQSIRFLVDGQSEPHEDSAFHGLSVLLAARAGDGAPPPADPGVTIDHVVVRTPDADRAIALWRDRLGLRLALDRAFPERGLRLVFFRSGGITLEFIAAHPPAGVAGDPDQLYGVSYRVPDLEARRRRLLDAGVDVSEIRSGMRSGTAVATVRSGTGGVPTLLLQAEARPSE